ncbi:hypothetical protein CR513_33456, partial [Mucuna pruriens]
MKKYEMPTIPYPWNKILYDVVPMEAINILLGRSWQFDRQVIDDGVTNKFSVVHKGRKVILKLLTHHEVIEDQLKMKKREKKLKKREN